MTNVIILMELYRCVKIPLTHLVRDPNDAKILDDACNKVFVATAVLKVERVAGKDVALASGNSRWFGDPIVLYVTLVLIERC